MTFRVYPFGLGFAGVFRLCILAHHQGVRIWCCGQYRVPLIPGKEKIYPCHQGTLCVWPSLAVIRQQLRFVRCHSAWACILLPDPKPKGLELYWLLINAFPDHLCLVSFSFYAMLGLVSQNGIFLSDEIRVVSS